MNEANGFLNMFIVLFLYPIVIVLLVTTLLGVG